ncbi:hypothetical protein COB55_03720 [Candidatus Wolfebacteria bacterium]|nr:MAG: hypothetical protein COB55_03720 [Candidatus Wolfebacteria bacterium]
MYSEIKVTDNKKLIVHVFGWTNNEGSVWLRGSTFPFVPVGTIVKRLSMDVPEGDLHGMLFYCEVSGPRRMGSGKTAYLDNTTQISSNLLLCWREGDKLVVKCDEDMSASELDRFSSFTRTNTSILVTDAGNQTVYISVEPAEYISGWTYKMVSMDSILKYITKKLTMEELDKQAVSEKKAQDRLEFLEKENSTLYSDCNKIERTGLQQRARREDLEIELSTVSRERDKMAEVCSHLCVDLKSRRFFRPDGADALIKLMEEVNAVTK